MFALDMSLDNADLYEGCQVHRFRAKRPRIDTPMFEGFDIVKKNAERIFLSHGFSRENKGDSIVLLGSMKAWAVAAVAVLAPEFFKKGFIEEEGVRKQLFGDDNGATEDGCPDRE